MFTDSTIHATHPIVQYCELWNMFHMDHHPWIGNPLLNQPTEWNDKGVLNPAPRSDWNIGFGGNVYIYIYIYQTYTYIYISYTLIYIYIIYITHIYYIYKYWLDQHSEASVSRHKQLAVSSPEHFFELGQSAPQWGSTLHDRLYHVFKHVQSYTNQISSVDNGTSP